MVETTDPTTPNASLRIDPVFPIPDENEAIKSLMAVPALLMLYTNTVDTKFASCEITEPTYSIIGPTFLIPTAIHDMATPIRLPTVSNLGPKDSMNPNNPSPLCRESLNPMDSSDNANSMSVNPSPSLDVNNLENVLTTVLTIVPTESKAANIPLRMYCSLSAVSPVSIILFVKFSKP